MTDRFRRLPRAGASAFAAAALLVLGACSDRVTAPDAPVPGQPGGPSTQVGVECRASVRGGDVLCAVPQASTPAGVNAALIGGQGSYVQVISSNVSYNGGTGTFQFDVRLANLLAQTMGSADGVALDPNGVRIFFTSEPVVTGGTGSVTVANEDGTGSFTGAGQPYFQYNEILPKGDTTATKTWQLSVPNTVETFSFTLYVDVKLAPALVINEVMPNPNAVNDTLGEWFEVYNAGLEAVNLNGWKLASANDAVHTINGSVVVPSRGYVVLGRSTNTALNGGVTVAYGYGTGNGTTVTLNNSNTDWLAIRSPANITADSVHWGLGANVPVGASRALLAPGLDNTIVMGNNWSTSTNPYVSGNADLGTPGGPNDGTPTTPAGPPATVTIAPTAASVPVGSTQQFGATARDANQVVTSTTFTWSSSNSSVATVNSSGLVSGVAVGTVWIKATAGNGVADSAQVDVYVSNSTVVYRNHLEFGTPTDANASDEILLNKPEFSLSYSPARGGPNWVSWDLNKTHFGGTDRCDCFAADTALPAQYRITSGDYSGSGYSRGHMVMSSQRTANLTANTRTFLMTNILPQLQDLNGGPWLQFENYTNDLARSSNKEVYNIAGGIYPASPTFLNNAGRVAIPSKTWKIIVVMPYGKGLADVTSASDIQVIAVNMPNQAGIGGTSWTAYRTTVDAIEAATGYDFLSALPDAIENAVEATQ
ncbi:MAG TPA: DNA/RNA non-specific endonuclease [Longimicrobium sp.]|nr:DNA/RNA non-specific endonuclease [Longimicrobium sp.]